MRGESPPSQTRHVLVSTASVSSRDRAWKGASDATGVHLGVGHELRSGLFLWARAERESVAPQDAVRAVPLLPTGNRVAHGIAFGISMKP